MNRVLALAGLLLVAGPAFAQTAPSGAAPTAASPPSAGSGAVPESPTAKAITIGSIVQLQSGGPRMTVVALTGQASVMWFHAASAAFKREDIPVAALKLAPELETARNLDSQRSAPRIIDDNRNRDTDRDRDDEDWTSRSDRLRRR
jgi:uncharacterized protein YodC (DUF2158 family)